MAVWEGDPEADDLLARLHPEMTPAELDAWAEAIDQGMQQRREMIERGLWL